MKKINEVLQGFGVYMFVALIVGTLPGPASAGERWPAGPCKDVQAMEAYVTKEHGKVNAGNAVTNPQGVRADLGSTRLHLLILLRLYCGADVGKKMEQDRAAMDAYGAQMEAATKRAAVARVPLPSPLRLPDFGDDYRVIEVERPQAPPPSVHCTTIKIGDDMASTNCN